MIQKITEQAVLFGARNALVGILARPVAAAMDQPAIVILNTGIMHRVGHHRMYVALSRALASAGHAVLRFDFAGIGDSPPRTDGLSGTESCMADIRDALDWLSVNRKAARFVLVGLCSGADHALAFGHTDPRVAGLVLLDPWMPATPRHYIRYVAMRLPRPRAPASARIWRSRAIRQWLQGVLDAARSGRLPWGSPPHAAPSRRSLEAQYRKSVDNGIRMLVVLTEETTRQTYREQMFDAFPRVRFGDCLRLEFFAGSDHTFVLERDRAELTRLILDWAATLDSKA